MKAALVEADNLKDLMADLDLSLNQEDAWQRFETV